MESYYGCRYVRVASQARRHSFCHRPDAGSFFAEIQGGKYPPTFQAKGNAICGVHLCHWFVTKPKSSQTTNRRIVQKITARHCIAQRRRLLWTHGFFPPVVRLWAGILPKGLASVSIFPKQRWYKHTFKSPKSHYESVKGLNLNKRF